MKKSLVLLIYLVVCIGLYSQTGSKSCYVAVSSLNLRSAPNQESEVIQKLKLYNNLNVINDTLSEWIKVTFNGIEGYVSKKYVKPGHARVTTVDIRVGAVCNDGTSSSATGRGACSHHGGVSYWRTKSKSSVEIINEN